MNTNLILCCVKDCSKPAEKTVQGVFILTLCAEHAGGLQDGSLDLDPEKVKAVQPNSNEP